eukprot:4331464-Amphidinium_carterae.1
MCIRDRRRCVSVNAHALGLDAAADKADLIIKSDAFKWQGSAVQGELRSATSWLRSLAEHQPIGMRAMETTGFLQEVITMMNGFLKITRSQQSVGKAADGAAEPVEETVEYSGRAALTILVAELEDVEKGTNAFALCSTWRHLLTPDESKTLEAVRLQSLKSASATMSSLKGKSEKTDAKSKKKKKGDAQSSMEALAMAALGMS